MFFFVDRRHEDLEEEQEIMNITAQAHDQVRQNHGFIDVDGFVFRNRNLVEKPAALLQNNWRISRKPVIIWVIPMVSGSLPKMSSLKNTPDFKPERK